MLKHNGSDDLLQEDWRDYIHNKLGREPWVYVYYSEQISIGNFALFHCALIDNSKVDKVLNNPSWDMQIGDGKPGCSVTYKNGEKIVEYHRSGSNDGIEPLVHHRNFYGIKDGYIEIAEEFRLLHNLYYNKENNKYIKIDENGDAEDIIIIKENKVKIKLKTLKQFLAIKDMHLAIYFSIDRQSKKSIEKLGLEKIDERILEDNIIYDFTVGPPHMPIGCNSFSRLIGKKLISGMDKEQCGIWPYEEEKNYEKFIIDYNENGEPVEYTCKPDELSNYFGANKGAPHYLTPVFFRRDVLAKYYSDPEKYSIEDNSIRCKGLWILRIDNNHEKYIIVFLGDLGRDLPYKEQKYWKSFNIPPEGEISEVNFKRSFLGEFTDPEMEDLVFKQTFKEVNNKWKEKFGWYLFKPLARDDEHNLKVIRIPVTNSQHEFDQQALSLSKILIDSLNEKKIEEEISDKLISGDKGITKFGKFLEAKELSNYQKHVKFLRSLWDLRNGSGHRKGDNYKRGAKYFSLNNKDLSEAFEEILKEATDLLNDLDDYFF